MVGRLCHALDVVPITRLRICVGKIDSLDAAPDRVALRLDARQVVRIHNDLTHREKCEDRAILQASRDHSFSGEMLEATLIKGIFWVALRSVDETGTAQARQDFVGAPVGEVATLLHEIRLREAPCIVCQQLFEYQRQHAFSVRACTIEKQKFLLRCLAGQDVADPPLQIPDQVTVIIEDVLEKLHPFRAFRIGIICCATALRDQHVLRRSMQVSGAKINRAIANAENRIV